jgi:uncharacterized protein (DUF1501 family)
MPSTRRDFLRAALGTSALVSLGAATPDWLLRSAVAAAPPHDGRDTVLVVLQLTGGNDGLNTVVPYTDDAYGRNRFTLRLPTETLHKIDAGLGFHPRMEACARLYRDGCLSIIQGVGSPIPDQNHETALRTWHTADLAIQPAKPEHPAVASRDGRDLAPAGGEVPGTQVPGQDAHTTAALRRQTGWLGRVADRAWSPATPDVTAVFVGPIRRPFAVNAASVAVPAIRSAEELTIHEALGGGETTSGQRATSDERRTDNLLQFVRQSTVAARAKSERIAAALKASGGDYPPLGLAGDLCTVAQLIRADVGIRIFLVELGGDGFGGFDNHANQLGNHGALLHQLSESVVAFVEDLERDGQLDRVLLMTFSEFGRTVRENGRRGTDHGLAAPLFLAGGRIKGGLIGSHPSLTDLENGALKTRIDFRRVYATVLDRWLGCESAPILGGHFEPLDVLAG